MRYVWIATECLVAGLVTMLLLSVSLGLFYLMLTKASLFMSGASVTLLTFLLGAVARYAKTTRSALHCLFMKTLFEMRPDSK
jgi:hypothetical protein